MDVSRRDMLKGAGVLAASFVATGAVTALGCAPQSAEKDDAANQGDAASQPEAQASGLSWLGEAPEIDESAISEAVDVDVLVVGDGTAGAFAAAAAAEAGAKVMVIEKNASGFGIRADIGAIGTAAQKAAGVSVKKDDILLDLNRYACYDHNPKLARTWAEKSGEAVDWYEALVAEHGMVMVNQPYTGNAEMKLQAWPVQHKVAEIPEGTSPAAVVHDYVVGLGGEYRYETTLVRLLTADGSVVGAIASNADGSYVKINAASVIVCTGGYVGNEAMMKALQPQTRNFSANPFMAFGHGDGAGVKACLWAGAAMADIHFCHTFDRLALPPDAVAGEKDMGKGAKFQIGSQPFLKVNIKGERFMNESCLYDFTLHASASQPGQCCVMIWDANYEAHMRQFDTIGCSRVFPFPNGEIANHNMEEVETQIAELIKLGYIQEGSTFEELAEKLNIDAATFAKTASHYNEMCAAGEDLEYGKEAFRMIALDTPPYYGVRMSGAAMSTMDGVITDEYARALNSEGEPIPGLYVAGNDSNSFFGHTYPNLMTGINAGRCVTFGRIAGQHAASMLA